MYQSRNYSATNVAKRSAAASNEEYIHAENGMKLEALIERSRQRTRDLQQIGKQYDERDPGEIKRFRRSIKLAVYDAEHRQERYVGRLHEPRLRPW